MIQTAQNKRNDGLFLNLTVRECYRPISASIAKVRRVTPCQPSRFGAFHAASYG
jgi:hypothetical protein